MPAIVSPSLVAPGLSSTSSPARARQAEEPQGRRFQSALDHSRASQADAVTAEGTDGTATRPGTSRRGTAGAKDETAPEIPNLDFFVPAVSAQVTAAAARAGAEAVTAAASRSAAKVTDGTDVQAALPGADAAADAAKAPAEQTLPAAEATANAALANAEPADAAAAEAPRAATSKASPTVAAQADAAAATAKADAALPATPAASSLLNSALTGTPAGTPTPAGRAGRADAASRDTTTATATGTAASAATARTDPLEALAARIEATAGSDAGVADDSTPNTPLAWMAAQPASAGIANGTAPTNSTPVLTLAPPIDSDAWAPALGQQMLRMSASGTHTAQLNINPENLGPMQITLKLGDDQAQAMFVSGHESVRKAVEAALPQLRTTLAEHGISLGQTSVGADTRQPAAQGSFAGDNPSNRPGSNGGSAYPGAARNGTAAASALPAAPLRSARAEGVVDTFA